MAIERISINIRSNIRQIKSELADVDSELKSLQKLKIDLNLQVRSDRLKEVKKEISDIDIDIKKLQANRAELRISDLQADKAKKKVQEINYEIGKLRSKKAKLQVEAQELKGADTQLNKINRRLEQLDHKKTRLQIDLDDAYETTKSLGRLKTSLAYINATKAKVNISSNIGDVGRQLDKLSNKMFGVLNPLKSQISQWIGLGAAVNIVNKAINEITGSVGSAISRVDTMNKYPKVMQALGHSAEQSQKSIADLSEGIEGLPTKLDDIVSTNQRMVSVAGNIDKATQATLGLNNAFLASGASTGEASRGMER
nr:MAG TPA: chromosome segregation ATPase [Caudoviricetes sp.]